jgi:hypothetical protein
MLCHSSHVLNLFFYVSLGSSPLSQELVAYACNPSYSGGRDQEDGGSKPARVNSLRDPISKKPFTKRAGRMVQGEGLSSSPSTKRKLQKEAAA